MAKNKADCGKEGGEGGAVKTDTGERQRNRESIGGTTTRITEKWTGGEQKRRNMSNRWDVQNVIKAG
jgi:hypothetical protein